ncbi:6132_t:CDS:2 [Acaulospora morrowiae]|uniref:6132_t:CDS:1 n=1 Tax=Acaulospora morrowiae TaxID=94023 RepID=A0A9N9I7E4_9GLOM|nr:6132_t:CDS:2 [Acaulospora morrowiae]
MTNTVERLWKNFIEYAKAYTENDNLLKYDVFFHKLVYHMRYKEHISIPDKIGQPETMRKKEIITKQPTLSNITKADQRALDDFLNTWNKAVSSLYPKDIESCP